MTGTGGRRHVRLLLAALCIAAASATPVRARCGRRDFAALQRNVAGELRCAMRRLVNGAAASCTAPDPPQCAGTAPGEVVTIVFGTPPAAAVALSVTSPQVRCQRAIARAAGRFVTLRLAERAGGHRAQRDSARTLERLLTLCGVPVAGDGHGATLPVLGGACTAVVGGAGTVVDTARVGRCLRAGLERIVDDVGPAREPPNIVLILTDDQRWDTLSYMPSVTQLAAQGLTFNNSFGTTSLCAPGRSSLYSGLYAHHHGIMDNIGAPRFDGSAALPVWLSDAGYITALFGKYLNANFQFAPSVPPGWREWQTFVEDGGVADQVYYDYTLNENGTLVAYGHTDAEYSTDLLRDRVLAFVRDHANQPFFVVYAPFGPHLNAVPARRHAGMFAGLTLADRPDFAEADLSDKPIWVWFWRNHTDADALASERALRVRELEVLQAVDEAVGAFTQALETLGLTDNTVVVFTSDNGYMHKEHWWAGKSAPYEESIRVPLVVRYPLLAPQPHTVEQMALNLDLAPTFAELAAATIPYAPDGRSLVDLLRGGAPPWRDDFLEENWSTFLIPSTFAVRTTRWKYISTPSQPFEELYDLEADPYELGSVASDPAYVGQLDTLRARLSELQAE